MPKLSKRLIEGKIIALCCAIEALESEIIIKPEERLYETDVEIKALIRKLEKEKSRVLGKL